jgi:hypothetical protein
MAGRSLVFRDQGDPGFEVVSDLGQGHRPLAKPHDGQRWSRGGASSRQVATLITDCCCPTEYGRLSLPKITAKELVGPIPRQEREEETLVFFAPLIHLDFEISVIASAKLRWLELL